MAHARKPPAAARTVVFQPSEASLEWLAFSRKSSGSILCAASAVAEWGGSHLLQYLPP
jgi:hypothetical protein